MKIFNALLPTLILLIIQGCANKTTEKTNSPELAHNETSASRMPANENNDGNSNRLRELRLERQQNLRDMRRLQHENNDIEPDEMWKLRLMQNQNRNKIRDGVNPGNGFPTAPPARSFNGNNQGRAYPIPPIDAQMETIYVQREELMTAISKNDLPKIKKLLSIGVNPNFSDVHGFTAALYASFSFSRDPKKAVEVIKLFAAAGADFDAKINDGPTLLHRLVDIGNRPEVVAALLEAGANPNVQVGANSRFQDFTEKDTPLTLVIKDMLRTGATNDKKKIIKELIKAGADVNLQNRGFTTPLALCTGHIDRNEYRPCCDEETVQILLDAGANLRYISLDATGMDVMHSLNRSIERQGLRVHPTCRAMKRKLEQTLATRSVNTLNNIQSSTNPPANSDDPGVSTVPRDQSKGQFSGQENTSRPGGLTRGR